MIQKTSQYRERALLSVLVLGGLVGVTDPLIHGAQPRSVIAAVCGVLLWGLGIALVKLKATRAIMILAMLVTSVVFLGNLALYAESFFFATGFAIPVAAALFMRRVDAAWTLIAYCLSGIAIATVIHLSALEPFYEQSSPSTIFQNTLNSALIIVAIVVPTIWKEHLFEAAIRREREQQRRLSAVIDTGYGAVIEGDIHGKIDFAAGRLLEKLGYKEEDLVGKSKLSFVKPRDRLAVLEPVHSAAAKYDVEARVRDQQGNYRWVRVSGGRITDDEGKCRWVTALQDVHEEVTQRQRVFELSRLESLGDLCGGLAHDFNNLLTVISAQSELISDNEVRSEIQRAQKSAAELTAGLLTFARKQDYRDETIDLIEFLSKSRPLLDRILPANINVDWELERGPLFVRIDPAQMQQVLINLVTNAQHAMPSGGALRIQAKCGGGDTPENLQSASNGALCLSICDTGRGMSMETQQRAIEPFYTTKPRGQGTGLGLSTVHGVVGDAGGEMQITSRLGVGTDIVLWFPIADPPQVDQKKATSDRLSAQSGQRKRVLLVEDREEVARAISMMLEYAGFVVMHFSSAEEAQCAIAEEPFELLISDVVLPGMSGIDLVEKLMAQSKESLAILISGHQQQQTELLSDYPDRVRFLPKPFSAKKLSAVADELLSGV